MGLVVHGALPLTSAFHTVDRESRSSDDEHMDTTIVCGQLARQVAGTVACQIFASRSSDGDLRGAVCIKLFERQCEPYV